MFFLSLFDVGYWLRWILMYLCVLVYKIVASLYSIFIAVSTVKLLDSGTIEDIFNKFQILLYVVMVFYISFTVVKYIVNPETASDKTKGTSGLIKRVIITVLLMAFMNTIFSVAGNIKEKIVEGNMLQTLITQNYDSKISKSTGKDFAAKVFLLFLGRDEKIISASDKCTEGGNGDVTIGEWLDSDGGKNTFIDAFKGTGNYSVTKCLQDQKKVSTGEKERLLTFNWLFALGVGGYLCYVFVMYTVEAGKAVFLLAFLQMISPIPIMCYLSPEKDGTFQKWAKQTAIAYFDVVIRLFIIYTMLFFCQILMEKKEAIIETAMGKIKDGNNFFVQGIIIAFLIAGLLLFAKQAPKLIKDLLPKGLSDSLGGTGAFSLGKEANKARKQALNAVGGSMRGIGRAGARAWKSFKHNKAAGNLNPYKAAKRAINRRRANRIANRANEAERAQAAKQKRQEEDIAVQKLLNRKKDVKDKNFDDLKEKNQKFEDWKKNNGKELDSLRAKRASGAKLSHAEKSRLKDLEDQHNKLEVASERYKAAKSVRDSASNVNKYENVAEARRAMRAEEVKMQGFDATLQQIERGEGKYALMSAEDRDNAKKEIEAKKAAAKETYDSKAAEKDKIVADMGGDWDQDVYNEVEKTYNDKVNADNALSQLNKKTQDASSDKTKAENDLTAAKQAENDAKNEMNAAAAVKTRNDEILSKSAGDKLADGTTVTVEMLNQAIASRAAIDKKATDTALAYSTKQSDTATKQALFDNAEQAEKAAKKREEDAKDILKVDDRKTALETAEKKITTSTKTYKDATDVGLKGLVDEVTAKRKEYIDVVNTNNAARLQSRLDQKAEAHQDGYQSVIGGFVGGAIEGTIQGAREGYKNDSINPIKNIVTPIARDFRNEQIRQEYYETGGDVGVSGYVEREILQPFGIGGSSAQMEAAVKSQRGIVEARNKVIKAEEAVISAAGNSKSTAMSTLQANKLNSIETKHLMETDYENKGYNLVEKRSDGHQYLTFSKLSESGRNVKIDNMSIGGISALFHARVDNIKSRLNDTNLKAEDRTKLEKELAEANSDVGAVDSCLADAAQSVIWTSKHNPHGNIAGLSFDTDAELAVDARDRQLDNLDYETRNKLRTAAENNEYGIDRIMYEEVIVQGKRGNIAYVKKIIDAIKAIKSANSEYVDRIQANITNTENTAGALKGVQQGPQYETDKNGGSGSSGNKN